MRKMLWLFPVTMVLVGCNICTAPMTWPGVVFWAILLIAIRKAERHSSENDHGDPGGRPAGSPRST